MRRLIAVALVAVTASLGTPAGVLAQSLSPEWGTVSGEALDAAGRALVNQRVELVQAGEVVQATATGSRGQWTFAHVAPGEYIVRMLVNGQVAGMRLSVAPGQTVANALIVAPSAAAPSAAFLAALGLLGGLAVGGAIAAAILTTAIITTGS